MTKKTYSAKPKKLSVSAPESRVDYDTDLYKWAYNQAKYLRKGEFTKLDIDNLIEEIEDLGKRERDKLGSHLENWLMHNLKVRYQPHMHTVSWDLSIKETLRRSQKNLEENPSLKPELKELLEESYYYARLKAAKETGLEEKTFPEECPWSLKEIFPNLEAKYCK